MTTLVFGGSGGIGAALARRLAARGELVHLAARNAERLDAVAGGTHATISTMDAMNEADIIRTVAEAGPSISGLAYCIGSIRLKPLSRLTEAEFIDDFRLNALGAALAIKAATPALRASGAGSVVLGSSVAVAQGFTSHASVAMAKGAVEGLTRALAAELAPHIRVNCIAPSLTRTPLAAAFTNSEQMAAAIAQLHALQRLGEPEDVAALADFLLGSSAAWMTGQIIGVDGGRSTLRTKG